VLLDRRRIDAVNAGGLQLPDYEELGIVVDGDLHDSDLRGQLRELRSKREFLILGLPNDDPAVDVPLLGRHLDVAIVVVQLGATRRDTLGTVLSDITKSGVHQVFAVTVDLGRRGLRRRNVVVSEVFNEPSEKARPRALPVQRQGERQSDGQRRQRRQR
jgi:hypothetical protein